MFSALVSSKSGQIVSALAGMLKVWIFRRRTCSDFMGGEGLIMLEQATPMMGERCAGTYLNQAFVYLSRHRLWRITAADCELAQIWQVISI